MRAYRAYINIILSILFTFTTAHADKQRQYLDNQVTGIFNAPVDMAIVPDGSKGYVLSRANSCVLIIDLSVEHPFVSGQIDLSGNPNIPREPSAMAYNQTRNELYVIDYANSDMFVINSFQDIVDSKPIRIKRFSTNIVVSNDGNTLYVCSNVDVITVINIESKSTSDIPLNEDADPYGMAIANNKLYVIGTYSEKIYVINTDTNSVIKTIKPDKYPFDAIASSDSFLYVSHDSSQGKISIINTVSDTLEKEIIIGENETTYKNPRDMAIVNQLLYVANYGDSSISTIDIESNTLYKAYTDPICSDSPEKIVSSPDGKYLYTVHTSSGKVCFIKTLNAPYILSLFKIGRGTVFVNDTIEVLPPWKRALNQGETVKLKAQPIYDSSQKWKFVNWSGDVIDTNNTVTIKMDGLKTVTANFVEIDNSESFSYSLTAGWHLISLPLIMTGDSVPLPYSKIFSTAIEVLTYKDGNLRHTDNIETGKGYWINLKSSLNVTISGESFDRYSIKLTPGWHLVGAPYKKAKPYTIPPDSIEVIYGHQDGTHIESKELYPGFGYWVRIIDECDFIF